MHSFTFDTITAFLAIVSVVNATPLAPNPGLPTVEKRANNWELHNDNGNSVINEGPSCNQGKATERRGDGSTCIAFGGQSVNHDGNCKLMSRPAGFATASK
ncbi:serine protein kinase [Apiospora arundinis]